MTRTQRMPIVALIACAGLAAGAWAQQDKPADKRPGSPGQTQQQPHDQLHKPMSGDANTMMEPGHYRTGEWILDQSVVGSKNETIAEVDDLLIDRGSGRAEYAILTTGTILGMGGRTIAVPCDSLRWDVAAKQFRLDATEEQLKKMPKWSEKDWNAYVTSADPGKASTPTGDVLGFSDYYYTQERTRPDYWDPYKPNMTSEKSTQVTGEVQSVSQTRTRDAGEQTVVTVKDAAGKTHTIALGPSWYVNGARFTPHRGDKISVDAYSLRSPGTGNVEWVASGYRINDHSVTLRDKSDPMWSQRNIEVNGRWFAQPYYRDVLLSKLQGAKLDCRSQDCGAVNNVIIDVNAHRVEYLSIDPNKNFLGIGDTKRLAPWSIVSVGLDNTVRLDTSKEMMAAAPATPEDLGTLNNSEIRDRVYRAYAISPPTESER